MSGQLHDTYLSSQSMWHTTFRPYTQHACMCCATYQSVLCVYGSDAGWWGGLARRNQREESHSNDTRYTQCLNVMAAIKR